jgi:hypothetical protein
MTSDKTLAALSRAVTLCGSEASDPPSRRLCSDHLAVEFENGQLRYARFGGVEVLRGIAFLVRDENCGAYSPQIGEAELKLDAYAVARAEAKNEQAS